MKNKKLKLSLIAIATIVASNTNAQTFYQCMPCPAGSYTSNGKCTPCPAGTYSQVTGATSSSVCTKCPAGTYSASTGASSANTCQPCPIGTVASSAGSKSCSIQTCTFEFAAVNKEKSNRGVKSTFINHTSLNNDIYRITMEYGDCVKYYKNVSAQGVGIGYVVRFFEECCK